MRLSVDDDKFLHNETDPRYRGASIPSRSFRMLQTLTNSAHGKNIRFVKALYGLYVIVSVLSSY